MSKMYYKNFLSWDTHEGHFHKNAFSISDVYSTVFKSIETPARMFMTIY